MFGNFIYLDSGLCIILSSLENTFPVVLCVCVCVHVCSVFSPWAYRTLMCHGTESVCECGFYLFIFPVLLNTHQCTYETCVHLYTSVLALLEAKYITLSECGAELISYNYQPDRKTTPLLISSEKSGLAHLSHISHLPFLLPHFYFYLSISSHPGWAVSRTVV